MQENDQPFINFRSFLINPDDIDQKLMCGICKKLVIQPQECTKCQKIFCSNCIYQWLFKKKKCPMTCSEKSLQLKMPSGDVLSSIQKLPIKCVNKNCDKIMKYVELKTHLKTCDKMAYKCLQGCNKMINKNEFDEHLKICEHRILSCQKCQIEYKFIENHNCINFLKEKIKNLEQTNKDLNNHLIVTNGKLEDQEQLIQQLMEQNKDYITIELTCDQGHNLSWVKSQHNLQCNKCAQYTEVIRYECNKCNYLLCQKCSKPIFKNQQCPLKHNLIYARQAPPTLICDLCNRLLKFLTVGVYSDRECDFDLCEDCFNKFYS